MNILLTAVGRRPYLVTWFREALVANGVDGKVIAADCDPLAPAKAFADDFIVAPSVGDDGYLEWLRWVLREHEIALAISVNDFELSAWANLPLSEDFAPLVRVSLNTQRLVEDKMKMSTELANFGVSAPKTWVGDALPKDLVGKFVTKGRFGSASRGLRFASGAELSQALDAATHEVTDPQGVPALEQNHVVPRSLIVVQEEVAGVEFGLDIICDLEGNFASVLARRKITMRAGETDRAVTVDPAPFEELARGIAAAVPHPGTFDVDVIVNADGTPFVIDINPRFGGGYPFSHMAGASVPNAYVAWRLGKQLDPTWLQCEPGVVAGKYVGITAVKTDAEMDS